MLAHRPFYRRTLPFAPFIVTLFTLVVMIWSGWQLVNTPYAGADWSHSTGTVVSVDPNGAANGLLSAGDRILTIDNLPLGETFFKHPKTAGDTLRLVVLRAGASHQIDLLLLPPPVPIVLLRLLPLLVALTFWGVSVSVLAFRPTGTQSNLFLLFCLVFSYTLAFGASGISSPRWQAPVFQALLWWVGPITIHFHLYFPQLLRSRYTRFSMLLSYLIAAFGSLLTLLGPPLTEFAPVPGLFAGSLIWLTGCLLCVVWLLIQSYRRAQTPEIQRQFRLVVLGGGIVLIALLVLLLLPYALIQQPLLPYSVVFILLLILPLTYGYAILSYRLIELDPYVSRVAAYMLVVTLLLGMYLTIDVLLHRLMFRDGQAQQTANLVTMLALTSTSIPLYRRLQSIVNNLFYGGSYDYRSAVQLVSHTLDQSKSPTMLPRILCEGIQKAMQLECVRLLCLDASGRYVEVGLACEVCLEQQDAVHLEPTSHIYQYLRAHPHPIYGPDLQSRLSDQPLSEYETRLLSYKHAHLWVPLSSGDQLLGLCVLGPKRGSEIFDVTDFEILHVITQLSSSTLQNVRFIDELRQRSVEQEKLHQQVLNAREEERKRVARELHDQIIQSLAGMNYHLLNLQRQCSVEVHDQIGRLQSSLHQTLDDVRRICADLRPPALDNLGLVSAIRSRLRALEQQTAWDIVLHVDGDPHQPLPEDVALGLFRVMQEALINVQKHAEAQMVQVYLRIQQDEIYLTVRDDGKGFQVPIRLGHLIEGHHFGLAGLQERLDMIGGTLCVTSAPDDGTCIQATVPLVAVPLVPSTKE